MCIRDRPSDRVKEPAGLIQLTTSFALFRCYLLGPDDTPQLALKGRRGEMFDSVRSTVAGPVHSRIANATTPRSLRRTFQNPLSLNPWLCRAPCRGSRER